MSHDTSVSVPKTDRKWQPDPDITEEQLKEMRAEVEERIIIARVGLLLRHPFFGNIATRLKIVPADDWLPTAATDFRCLYYNTQFFNAMNNKEIEFVVAHEILHCVYDHFFRRDERDPQIYNIAADYIVNNTLVKERIGELPKLVDCFQDMKYDGWTSEEVYDDIFEKYDSEALKQLGELLDEHIDWEEGDEGDEGSDGKKNGKGGKGRPSKMSKEELRKIRDEIKESMISAAQTAGNVPAGVERLIKEFTEPKMNWRELLRQQIQSSIKSDYTFARPSRKSQHTGASLPGMDFDDTIDICIALDLSGSISTKQCQDFLSEVKGIMEEYKDYRIHVWCFDTDVYAPDVFTADDGRDLMDYEIKGGGGTDFMCNWTFMKEEGIEPKQLVMFTDMGCWGEWGDPDYCPTLFVNHSGRPQEAPFGVTVEYSDS